MILAETKLQHLINKKKKVVRKHDNSDKDFKSCEF